MLNGVDPIIIFKFALLPTSTIFNAVAGIPIIEDVVKSFGIPIPIYLSERIFGIVLNSEEKSMDVETNVQTKSDSTKPDVKQRGLNNVVTLNMTATKDSITLSALLALSDICFQKLTAKDYTISYLNGSTIIFDGLLESFHTTVDSNTDKIEVTMKISKAPQNTTVADPVTPSITKVTGAIP
jgi:hypothetical protein